MYFGAGSMCYSLRDEMHTANATCSCDVVCYGYISLADSCIQLLGACPLQSVAYYSPRRLWFVPSGVDAEFLGGQSDTGKGFSFSISITPY